jgi:hypothetical protein
VLLPASSTQQAFHDKISSSGDGTLSYARVFMKPLDLISGEFFNSYIKFGNVIMLSEGRSGTDNVFSLSDGVLRIEVDKPTYEKLGLEGRAVGGEGKKHVKARFGKTSSYFCIWLDIQQALSKLANIEASYRNQPPPPIYATRPQSL